MNALDWIEKLTQLNYVAAARLSNKNGFKAYRLADEYLELDGEFVPKEMEDLPNIALYVDSSDNVISYRLHNKDKLEVKYNSSENHTSNANWQENLVGLSFQKARFMAAEHGYFAYYVAPEYLHAEAAPVPKVYTDSPMIGLVVNKQMQVIGHTARKKAVPSLV